MPEPGKLFNAANGRCTLTEIFSGREAGRGIGLGLPKARRLIESSGGSLEIESRPGQGTRCILDLPVARSA